jgi:hypothetical protein
MPETEPETASGECVNSGASLAAGSDPLGPAGRARGAHREGRHRRALGAFAGVLAAHTMFELPAFVASRHVRQGPAQMFSEFVATFGLLAVIWGCARLRSAAVPFAVAAYITAAYWFTSSTAFANPAVTLARMATNTFAGIRPIDVPAFLVAQAIGAAAATALFRWLAPLQPRSVEAEVASPDDERQSA